MRFRRSGILKMFCIGFNHRLITSTVPPAFVIFSRAALREVMRRHMKGAIDFSVAQNPQTMLLAACGSTPEATSSCRTDFGSVLELRQIADIDRGELLLERIAS